MSEHPALRAIALQYAITNMVARYGESCAKRASADQIDDFQAASRAAKRQIKAIFRLTDALAELVSEVTR